MKNYLKTLTICMLIAALLLAGCAKEEEKPQEVITDQQDIIQEVIGDIVETIPEEVGGYVTPAESNFTWESAEGGVKITSYTGTDTAIIVPDMLGGKNVVAIDAGTFDQVMLTGIQLPDTLLAVEEQTFLYHVSLLEVALGEGTQTIGANAFEGCVALTKVELGESLQDIEDMAFTGCQELKSIRFPEGLKSIKRGAFGMTGLEEVLIPGSVEVGDQAFSGCPNLKTVEIKEGVTRIADKVFETCPMLETAKIPASVVEMGIRVFNQCENVTIIAPSGSVAEAYAKENDVAFKAS